MITNKKQPSTKLRLLAGITLVALLGGCATFSPDGGFNSVESVAKEHLGKEVKWVKTDEDRQKVYAQVTAILAKPLTADDAVQVALLNNAGLQATYSNLGIAEADLVQAGRLHNPGFSFQRLEKANVFEYERKFIFDVFGLLTMPTRTALEQRRFDQTKRRVTGEVMRIAADTRRAYLDAVAAQQTARYMDDVRDAAEASAQLADRMAKVGNWSKLDQARQQVFYVEVMSQVARSHQAARSEREKLTRLMGLWGAGAQFTLSERLPDLPAAPREINNLEQTAMSQRMDVQMAKQEVEGLAKSLGLTKATRFINVLDVSYLNKSTAGEPNQTGYEVELQIPIFDWGDAKVAKAEAMYMQAVNRVAEIAVNARSQTRGAYSAYRTAYDISRHYRDDLVPLRKRISEENLLRYNGMLIGTFELLADAREQVLSVNAYISTLREFWLADTNLKMALLGAGTDSGMSTSGDTAMPGESSGGH
ncbi:TolC family protein [Sulfurirhabdus autotrophica]|uniref:Outer membrane protein TolC n=1 Tax=Sulfurirhabdus autotrophica TaxID=1706046 RepID=A0A4R3YI48_9PROT|nr:TolC family protein [Sulfurirhabdus autotrophica]TCV90303.1 outer membrane protein TolC [Sulfurirhabdus autotrophica]